MATANDNPCAGCIHFRVALQTNPNGQTCEQLGMEKKCPFFVDAEGFDKKRTNKIANALLSDKTDVKDLEALYKLIQTLKRDRSKAFVADINLGDWITFHKGGEVRRERVGLVEVGSGSGSGYVLVGSEVDPVKVTPDRISKIEAGDGDFQEFRVLTPKQRKRIQQIRRQERAYKRQLKSRGYGTPTYDVTVYDPDKMTVIAATSGSKKLTSRNASMTPHFVDSQAWIKKHVDGVKVRKKGQRTRTRWRPTPYAVYCNDVPHQFFVKHGLDSRPNYCDLRRPVAGTHDFVFFAKSLYIAEDIQKWLIARYHADGWPKEGAERFKVITRKDAFHIAYPEDEGRFPMQFFHFAMTTPGHFENVDYHPREEYTTKSGKKKLRKAKPILRGRAIVRSKDEGDFLLKTKLYTRWH